ncbi:MAG: glycosyltransferase family 4 protein [Solirubrobacterales bacterium]
MLAQSYAPIVGGVERVVEDLSGELSRRGHEVSVATLRQPGAGVTTPEGPVPVHALPTSVHRLPGIKLDAERHHAPPVPDPATVFALSRLLRRERPDVVHAHNWLIHSYLPLDRRSDAALVLSMHDYGLVCATKRFLNRGADCTGPRMGKCVRCASDYYGRVKGVGVAVGTRLGDPSMRRHVDVLLPVSTAVRDRCGLTDAELYRVVPNFIGELPPAPAADDPGLARLPAEPFILYFGDVTVDKGGGQLVEAYKALEGPPPLVLIGRCYLPELEEVPGVMALGPMPHRTAIEALRRALFTVVPSLLPETFGLVALETAAAGKPIVASAIGGLTDVVVDGETGLLVAPGNREALSTAMQRLLADPDLRAQMGAAARLRAEEFGPDAVVPQFEQAYELALRARRARRQQPE